MTKMVLYTGNGVSLSPVYAQGRRISSYVRLIAEEGMAITNGTVVTTCLDVPETDIAVWTDCELPETEAEISDTEALAIITGESL